MPTIMCTRNLWRAIGGRGDLPIRQPYERNETRLASWSVRELPTAAGFVAVALEETTYLTVIFPLLALPDFLPAFGASAETALTDLGVSARKAAAEARAIVAAARFAKNDNRSLLGSVNDVAFHASIRLEHERTITIASLRKAQRELNGMPHVNREPSFPDQAVQLLFSDGAFA